VLRFLYPSLGVLRSNTGSPTGGGGGWQRLVGSKSSMHQLEISSLALTRWWWDMKYCVTYSIILVIVFGLYPQYVNVINILQF